MAEQKEGIHAAVSTEGFILQGSEGRNFYHRSIYVGLVYTQSINCRSDF